MIQKLFVAIAVAAALAGAAVVASSQAASSSRSTTLIVFERSEKVQLIDNPPAARSRTAPPGFGDALAFHARLTNAAGRVVGHLYGSGVFTNNSAQAVINGVYAMAAGDLDIVVTAVPGYKKAIGAIVGGTGAFAGARGTVTSVALRNGDFRDTITLLR